MNRGSSVSHSTRSPETSSFNEAPIHESGKSVRAWSVDQGCLAFNEAPIHESGKSAFLPSGAAASASFNEAPIHESGKCVTRFVFGRAAERPSMRPRFMNRGSGPKRRTSVSH